MKDTNIISGAIGVITGIGFYLFGGWDPMIIALLIFMGIDITTGILCAAVFKKSKKTDSGGLQSKIGFIGLAKKVSILFFVLIGQELDMVLNVGYFRNAIIIAYMANELLSIIENTGLMGLKIPSVISKSIDILSEKAKEEEGKPIE